MSVIFGKDLPDKLILAGFGGSNMNGFSYLRSEFELRIKHHDRRNYTNYLKFFMNDPEQFLLEYDGHMIISYDKSENYNFEETIEHFFRNVNWFRRITSQNHEKEIFILKDNIWYISSIRTEMMLVPVNEDQEWFQEIVEWANLSQN